MERSSAAPQSGDTGAAAPGGLCGSRYFQSGSEAFRLLARVFSPEERERVRPATASERKAMSRLVKSGLVAASKENHADRSRTCTVYSLTPAGRACYVAAELGLSFPQFCYLACARWAIHHSLFSGESAFFDKNLRPMFDMFFPDLSPEVTRRALTRKGFFEKRAAHVYGRSRRLAEVEENYAALMDELYRWMRKEYETRLLEMMQDPLIAKMLGFMQGPPADGNVSEGNE